MKKEDAIKNAGQKIVKIHRKRKMELNLQKQKKKVQQKTLRVISLLLKPVESNIKFQLAIHLELKNLKIQSWKNSKKEILLI